MKAWFNSQPWTRLRYATGHLLRRGASAVEPTIVPNFPETRYDPFAPAVNTSCGAPLRVTWITPPT